MTQYQIIPVTPFQQNCTILWDEETKRGAVSDPGGDLHLIDKFIADKGIILEKILVTHAHLDHVGKVAEMARTRKIPIIGPHKDDQYWIDLLPESAAQFNFDASETFTPDQWLEHGDVIEAAGASFDVVHCPGHTPGHVVFVQREQKMALVGDVIFKGSIGRTDFPHGDYQQLISSITQRLWSYGEDITFIPGHGPTSTFGFERKTNPFVGDAIVD
ncbi:MAG: MBL fold metallo-hydrolase [Alphaproteobacteria bacterium]|nr:MBL fold metallo-hydrolase [Alphaproteobacteria bacterium]MBE8220290.1 MBL fold metallo-hydrolase [Alphaproteobacteria bacterium]